MKKIVAVALLAIVLLTTGASFAEDIRYILCNPKDYVNVRMTPSSDGQIVGRFDCGDSFETDGVIKRDKKNKKWLHVINAHLESCEAWVCTYYVQDMPVTVEDAMVTVIGKGRTAIRKYPNGKVNKWVRFGDEMSILAMSEEWALTKRGYISLECVEVWYGRREVE